MLNLDNNTTFLEDDVTDSVNIFLNLRLRFDVDGQPCSIRKLSSLMNKRVLPSRICELEKGRTPSIRELNAYHEFFGVSYDYLLGADELVRQKDSFSDIINWLSSSKQKDDKKLFETLVQVSTTDKGLALLYYLSKYLSSTESYADEEFLLIMAYFKKLDNIDRMSYLDIRQSIDNMCGFLD